MSDETVAAAPRGFRAWHRGDFTALEAIFDPDVEWQWFEPREWDCRNHQDVMRTLRDRYQQGFAGSDLDFVDGGGTSVVVVAHPAAVGGEGWPVETDTVITFHEGKVTRMRDFRTKEEALAAIR
jgi:ketosteroid isomerase-like protein